MSLSSVVTSIAYIRSYFKVSFRTDPLRLFCSIGKITINTTATSTERTLLTAQPLPCETGGRKLPGAEKASL